MSYTIEHVTADQSTFDKFHGATHGPAEYREWVNQTREAKEQLAEYDRLWKLVPIDFKATLTTEANVDAQILMDTTNDIGEAIRLIQAGKPVNKEQLVGIMEVQSSALESLRITNETLDALFALSFFSFMMNTQFRNIERAAQEALPKVKALMQNLERAQRKAFESKMQLTIDAGLTVLMIFLPEITVLTRIGIAVGQWGMDKILGGEKSTPTRDRVSDKGSEAAIVQAALQDWKWLTPGENKVVTKAGQKLAIVGLYFDQDEVRAMMERVDVAKAAVDAAISSMRKLKALVERHRPAMVQFRMQMQRAAQRMQDAWDQAKTLRWDRLTLMSDADYRPLVRVRWKIEAPAVAK
ncbi:MAG TPA: hypothetical protein VL096_03970 [Pirellulaceae bacterium]|nr:hypothetical protein [Pirellulaceae bacterium]